MQLNFKKFGNGFPLVILHGLMGSLDNWQTLAKQLGEDFEVYCIDQRNHGRSPHSDEFDYTLLVQDLVDFLHEQKIEKCHLLGHSMGGKTAMHLALEHSELVQKIIIVDIAPTAYEDRHRKVFKALNNVDLATLTDRATAENKLKEYIADNATIQFLLKNLYRDDANHFQWRFNLKALENAYDKISDGIHTHATFTNETLFIKGGNSDYINAGNYSEIMDLFPNNELAEIQQAGHWVHAEQPAQFIAIVKNFLLK